MFTCATPFSVDNWRASRVSAYSSTLEVGKVSERSARNMIGVSAGFTLRMVGGFGMVGGSLRGAADVADCTSSAAPSRLRSRLNWMVMVVWPCELDEVIESTPAMLENWLS